jgi:phosphatidylglycerophosphatase A
VASAAEAPVTRLALAIPLTVPPEPSGLIPAESLESYTSPTGILTRNLDAVEGEEVALGIDPMIIASIRILGNTAPQSALDWLDRLGEAANETFALSYADSDLAALSQAGSTSVLAPTSFPIDPSRYPVNQANDDETEETPTPGQTTPPAEPEVPTTETLTEWPYTIDGLLWPRPNTVTSADLASFNAAAPTTTLLSSGNVTATPGASAAVGDHGVLVYDEMISRMITAALTSITTAEWLAVIDQIAAELVRMPGAETIFATFDRSAAESPRLADTVAALRELEGVQPSTLATALDEPKATVRVADIPVDADRVSRVRLMLAAEARIVPFSSVLDDPTQLTGERRLSLLGLSSNSWIGASSIWVASVDEWLERSNAILTSVQIAESSTLNFFQDKGNLPIAVSNELDYPVTVYVTVRSSTGILVVLNNRVPLEIPAGSQARASVPVQSIANGQASLQVSLSSGSNVAIGSPHTVAANVVAGWETTATFVIAALLVILFVAGIVRTVLKRRKARDEKAAEEDQVQGG